MFKRFAYLGAVALILFQAACSAANCSERLASIALCDAPEPRPRLTILVYDPSAVGTSPARLDTVVTRYVEEALVHPGWKVVVALVDTTLGATRELTRFVSGPRPVFGQKARSAAEIVEQLRAAYRGALNPHLTSSHLVEGMAKLLRAARLEVGAPDVLIEAVLLGDLLEEGTAFGSFECRPLPTTEGFVNRVLQSGLYPPAGTASIRVTFAYVDWGDVEGTRCPVDGSKRLAVENLWKTLFERLGITVRILPGAPDPREQHLGMGEPVMRKE